LNSIGTRVWIEKGVEIVIAAYSIGCIGRIVYATNIIHLTAISVSHIIASTYRIKSRVVAAVVGVDAIGVYALNPCLGRCIR
jgi:hypothetical protein